MPKPVHPVPGYPEMDSDDPEYLGYIQGRALGNTSVKIGAQYAMYRDYIPEGGGAEGSETTLVLWWDRVIFKGRAIMETENESVFYPSSFYEDIPDPNQVILRVPVIDVEVEFKLNFVSSQGYCREPAQADSAFIIRKTSFDAGSSTWIDTIMGMATFFAGSRTATFTSDYDWFLSAGDILEIIAPNDPDPLLKGPAFSLAGIRRNIQTFIP